MKVKIVHGKRVGEVAEAKRFKDLNQKELEESIGVYNLPNMWNDDAIFIHEKDNEWLYMLDSEVLIISK